jgi:ABC-type transporter Mla subunit MlaD
MSSSSLALKASSAPSPDDRTGACLEAARGAIEGRFLEVSDVLSRAVDGMNALIASLDRMKESLDGDSVATAARELARASDTLRRLPQSLEGRFETLSGLVKVGADLTKCIEDMYKHLAYLRVFGVNIKITSGGIAAAGPEFAIFAQEICDCIELGRSQLDTFRADLGALDGDLRQALSQEADLARRCDELLPAVPDSLVSQVSAITAHQARIGQISQQVASLAREVRKKVASALAALQIGDITRQRIEHVQFGLSLLDAPEVRALPSEARERLETFMRQLLIAQLDATARDFRRDVSRIGLNVGAMAADASEILRLRDHAEGQGGEGNFLRGLEASVGKAFALVDDIEAGERSAETVSRSAARSARDLATQVAAIQNMRADVQMMAMNTTLKCSRIGETGKPLGVIAIELRQHATHLETSAGHTMAALESLFGSTADDATDDGEALAERQASAASAAAEALRDAVERIRKTGDEVEGDLASAARQGGEVVDMLRQAAARFDFDRQVGGHLDEALDLLKRDARGEGSIDDLTAILAPLMAKLSRTYTMAQERDVHAPFADRVGEIPELNPHAQPPAAQSDDDVLF